MNREIIKMNYDRGLWSAAMVEVALRKNIISQEEFISIVGAEYLEPQAIPMEENAELRLVNSSNSSAPTEELRLLLTKTGTYHTLECGKAGSGVKLTLTQIAEATDSLGTPCGVCRPPALPALVKGE